MLNYINGELYRLSHKKSSNIYFAVIFTLFVFFVILTGNQSTADLNHEMFEQLAFVAISILPVFVGILVFTMVYNDDLSANTLGNTISSGISKTTIPLAKIIIAAIYLFIVYFVAAFFFFTLCFVCLKGFDGLNFGLIISFATINYLQCLGYFAIAGIVSFFSQKSTISTITASVIILGIANSILSLIASFRPAFAFLYDYSLTTLIQKASKNIIDSGSLNFEIIGFVALYIFVGVLISTLIIRKKDIKTD